MRSKYHGLNKIKALSKELAAKIAAGEVVERPLSIVKELLENSIDAGAGAVTVEIKRGGKEYIRVTDNGKGIEKDQLELAFTRYATSKIATEEDLGNIVSLGFRGEALASVAAVSRVELISKPADMKIGGKIIIEGGEEKLLSDAGCEDGTTIIVRDLFFNLPVRKKFMKPDNTESSLIADYLQKMALAYPDIKLRFINNGSILFSTLGKGDLFEVIKSLYSPQTARSLVEVNYSQAKMHIYGYTSGSEFSKTNKRGQVFFVNGRWIKSKLLDSAVAEAYHDKLFDGRYPVCYLFLEFEPSAIDVNVHPSKTEIKFFDEALIKDFTVLGIRKALLAAEAAPNIADLMKKPQSFAEAAQSRMEGYSVSEVPPESSAAKNIFLSLDGHESFFQNLREEQQVIESQVVEVSESVMKELRKERRFYFKGLKAIAQIFTTYILAVDDNNLYIVDQHAAHERIMYERLLSKFNGEEAVSQILIAPILIHASSSQTAAFDQWGALLSSIGFSIESFGPNEFLVKEIPASLKLREAELFINSVMESDVDDPENLQEKRDAIISASCKAAVKGGDKLNKEEIEKLFEDLDSCENPFSCPHGRPTFLRFSEGEIERFFKRK